MKKIKEQITALVKALKTKKRKPLSEVCDGKSYASYKKAAMYRIKMELLNAAESGKFNCELKDIKTEKELEETLRFLKAEGFITTVRKYDLIEETIYHIKVQW